MTKNTHTYERAIALSNISPAQEEMLAHHMYNDVTRGRTPSKSPTLTFVCGLPGVGKTTRCQQIAKQNPNAVIMGEDDAYKYHPHLFELNKMFPVKLNSRQPDGYDFIYKTNRDGEEVPAVEDFATNVYTGCMIETLVRKYDLVIDGLISENMLLVAHLAKERGYQVNFDVVTTPKRMQEINLINRYEDGLNRFQAACSGQLPQTAENVPHPFCRLHTSPEAILYDGEVLEQIEQSGYSINMYDSFSSKKIYSSRSSKDNPSDVFVGEYYRPASKPEQENILQRQSKLQKIADKRNATTYDKYIISSVSRGF